jgi:hypothetical protein
MDCELTKLRRARSRAHLALKQAEALVAGYQAKLADLEARIQAIAPDLQLPVRFREKHSIFARGELPRLALGIMREEGKPLPVAVIALQAEYAAWLDALPESLQDSATAQALQAIVDLDLNDLAAMVPPRGYGRD